jgi:hypothetical protein
MWCQSHSQVINITDGQVRSTDHKGKIPDAQAEQLLEALQCQYVNMKEVTYKK